MKLLIAFLVASTVYACPAPPSNVRITGADPCTVMPIIEREWREVLKRAWFTEHVRQLFTGQSTLLPTEDLAAMGRVQFIAHPGESFYDSRLNGDFYGVFTPGSDVKIDFALGTPTVLRHEMAHWFYWRFRQQYGEWTYLDVGHQTEGDPFWQTLGAIERMWYAGE